MRTPTLLEAALWYAKKGFEVFPVHFPIDGFCSCGGQNGCSPCKHPSTKHGFRDATRDEGQIRRWWADKEWNIGLRGGPAIFLDVDTHKGGDETLLAYDPILDAPEVRTPKGGSHLYLDPPGVKLMNAVEKLPGLDLRTDLGYVLAPPSRTLEGVYTWKSRLNGHFGKCPDWLIEAFREQDHSKRDPALIRDLPQGQRNHDLYRCGCRLRYAGADDDEVYAAMVIFNEKRLKPPLERGELLKVAKQVCKHPPGVLILDESPLVNGHVPEGVRKGTIADLAGEYAVTGLPTGFRFIDENTTTGGLADKQVSVFSAYTGTGKTGAILQVADYAIGQGVRVVFATFADGDATDLRDRLLIMRTGWKGKTAPDLSESLREHWLEQKAILADSEQYPFYVYDATKGHGRRLLEPCLEYAREVSPGLLIVDYAQKVRSSRGKSPMEHAEDCCDALAEFAGEMGIPVLLGSQLTLGNQKAGTLDITKGSREWEEAAALHMKIRVFEGKDLEKLDYAVRDIAGISEWSIVKNRRSASHPAKKVCYARWDDQRIRFEELF